MYQYICTNTNVPIQMYQYKCTNTNVPRHITRWNITTVWDTVHVLTLQYKCTNTNVPIQMYQDKMKHYKCMRHCPRSHSPIQVHTTNILTYTLILFITKHAQTIITFPQSLTKWTREHQEGKRNVRDSNLMALRYVYTQILYKTTSKHYN